MTNNTIIGYAISVYDVEYRTAESYLVRDWAKALSFVERGLMERLNQLEVEDMMQNEGVCFHVDEEYGFIEASYFDPDRGTGGKEWKVIPIHVDQKGQLIENVEGGED